MGAANQKVQPSHMSYRFCQPQSRGSTEGSENEKTLEFIRNPRVLLSEVDGARTRNLRIDSPVL
jgi:hypothetical protein